LRELGQSKRERERREREREEREREKRERERREREREREKRERERERKKDRKMALLATYPDLTLPMGRDHPACYISPSPSLVPFPLNSVNQKLVSPACHEPPR
jgi:hypothetical protein